MNEALPKSQMDAFNRLHAAIFQGTWERDLIKNDNEFIGKFQQDTGMLRFHFTYLINHEAVITITF